MSHVRFISKDGNEAVNAFRMALNLEDFQVWLQVPVRLKGTVGTDIRPLALNFLFIAVMLSLRAKKLKSTFLSPEFSFLSVTHTRTF